MKNILLPTDFSYNSKNAIDYALQLFKNDLCTFYFFHVQKISQYTTDDLMTSSTGSDIYQTVIIDAKKELKEYVNLIRVKHKNNSHIFKESIDYDNFTDAINQTVQLNKIDIIIMGTNGRTGAAEVVFGSNTLNVIRNVKCPTITVPHNYTYKLPKHLLFIPDKDEHLTTKNSELLTDLYMKFKTVVSILKIDKKADLSIKENQNLEKSIMSLKTIKPNIHTILNVPLPEAIDSFVQLMNVDIVSLFVKKESFLDRLFKGSITDNICYGSRVPLLLMHEEK